jgi:hypothetical protein
MRTCQNPNMFLIPNGIIDGCISIYARSTAGKNLGPEWPNAPMN